MLDFPSTRTRKWAGTGLLCIFFGLFFSVKAMELRVHGALTSHVATIGVTGPNRAPVLTFSSSKGGVVCPVFRCLYEGWRNDLGKVAEVSIDEEWRVARLQVGGQVRFTPEDLQQRVNQRLVFVLLLIVSGLGMCLWAWRINQRQK
jgi:hypothetical protein